VHVITVPKPGAPRDLLWQRFTSVLGLTDVDLDLETTRANPSMGVPETALVRRVNARVNDGVLAGEDYRRLVRELLAHQTLSRRSGSPRLGLPDDVRAWAGKVSESWIAELDERGYHVVGSLDELRPDSDALPFADPDHPDEADVADAAVESLVTLLQEAARLHESEQRAVREREAAFAELERGRGLWFRVKRRLVISADDHRTAAAALAFYRRLRGSSSRSQ
jgi:hypothetical protein